MLVYLATSFFLEIFARVAVVCFEVEGSSWGVECSNGILADRVRLIRQRTFVSLRRKGPGRHIGADWPTPPTKQSSVRPGCHRSALTFQA